MNENITKILKQKFSPKESIIEEKPITKKAVFGYCEKCNGPLIIVTGKVEETDINFMAIKRCKICKYIVCVEEDPDRITAKEKAVKYINKNLTIPEGTKNE